MEIIKSRYGLDRAIERIDSKRLRVSGESQFQRLATDKSGNTSMFDFEGGPCLSVGGEITFQTAKWEITHIEPVKSIFEGLSECILTVSLKL